MRWKDYRIARERMVKEQLYDRGIRDKRVLEAMLRIPRHVFLDKDAGSEAYRDHSFPIGYSQTMTQPFMVAYLAEQLRLTGAERVLEVGTGSGYQAAVIGDICASVFTIERVPELVQSARHCLHELLYANVVILQGDGAKGWPEFSPYDRILLTAATSQLPTSLLAQLTDGGMLVGPVEKKDHSQEIVRLIRVGDKFELERLGPCSFVPLVRDRVITGEQAAIRQSEWYGR
jgi:protein-L-isoaspartate(D-aspartate) O-methyltransferase